MAIQKKVCMLGSFGVGKTSLVSQYVHSIFSEEYLSTIGVKIDKKQVDIDEKSVNIILWDLAGDDHFDNLQPTYLMGTSGFILVIDGCRFDTLTVAFDILKKHSRLLASLPFICAINKEDLKADWEITNEQIDELVEMGWDVVLTSAKDKAGVEALFETITRKMITPTVQLEA